MKFCEAMDKLKQGAKVTRNEWKGSVYFKIVEEGVRSFQPKLMPYIYDDDIMVSDGWLVEGKEEEYKFCDIIPFLQSGLKAMLKDWKEMFIFVDRSTRSLVVHSMDQMPFIPDFESFTAIDWIEIE